jgi:hypothetical protein
VWHQPRPLGPVGRVIFVAGVRSITVAHGHATLAVTCGGPGQTARPAILATRESCRYSSSA